MSWVSLRLLVALRCAWLREIAGQQSKTLDRYLDQPFDAVITVCEQAHEACPVFFGARERFHWSFADPSKAEGTKEQPIAEHSVYVQPDQRGGGVGQVALEASCAAAERLGLLKRASRIFPENVASLALHYTLGFREVGVYRRHGALAGSGATASSSRSFWARLRSPERVRRRGELRRDQRRLS